MKFDLQKSLEILERTPGVLDRLLGGLSQYWTDNNEGSESWSPCDVLGHLVHGEQTDWNPGHNHCFICCWQQYLPGETTSITKAN